MTVTILPGDAREVLRFLPSDGRFRPGERRSPGTEFKPGEHWRPRAPHWDREWLLREYVEKQRSTGDIAREVGCTDGNLLYWLRKHGIPRRDVSGARRVKHWGAAGEANPQYGLRGPLNSRWQGGNTPERQASCAKAEARAFLQFIRARDGFSCRQCGVRNPGGRRDLHVHHIRSWAKHPELRFVEENAVTLCRKCHLWVHSKANTERAWLP